MRKLMLLAAMLAMVLAITIPAMAQQGGDQDSENVATAVNDCDQYFEQNQVAVQQNDIDQYSLQVALQDQDIDVDDITVFQPGQGDDEGVIDVDVNGTQSITQVGNVAVPVQYVNQEGTATQDCTAIANALTIQYQNNQFWAWLP